MNRSLYADDLDIDSEELSPDLQAQLDRFENTYSRREFERSKSRRRKLKLKRQLEDWQDARRMREDFDYLH